MAPSPAPPPPPPPGDAAPRAVALRYDPASMTSPRVVAAGTGPIAERIMALARAHGVPVKEDPDLVAVLAALDPGDQIPPELYQAVAEVLAFVYHLNAARAPGHTRPRQR